MTEVMAATSASQSTKGSKTATLFTDENLDDTAVHTSSTGDFSKLIHKTLTLKTTHTGTLTDYFITVKVQVADADASASYRTLGTVEFEEDDVVSLSFNDSCRYLRITAQAFEGSASNYVTINAAATALGE